jgi:hypothetical protein
MSRFMCASCTGWCQQQMLWTASCSARVIFQILPSVRQRAFKNTSESGPMLLAVVGFHSGQLEVLLVVNYLVLETDHSPAQCLHTQTRSFKLLFKASAARTWASHTSLQTQIIVVIFFQLEPHNSGLYSIGKIICRDLRSLRLNHRAGSCRLRLASAGPRDNHYELLLGRATQ